MKEFSIEPFLHAENNQKSINTKEISELLVLRPEQLLKPHKISFYAVNFYCEGRGKHSVDFNCIDVKEKHMLFLSQNQIAQFHDPVSYKGRVLIFTEDFLCRNNIQTQFFGLTNLFNDPLKMPYVCVESRFEELLSLFNFISEELSRPYSELQTCILNNYLFNILLIADQLYKPQDHILDTHPYKLLVSKFKSFVSQKLSRQYTIQDITDHLNVSIRTLEKAFVEIEKSTPKKWMAERMVLEIKRNLACKEYNISEVAYSLGFNEVTNFTKFFKSNTGLTPSQFRENLGPV
ncbi:helix-turn-helix domain-containing protein [Chryseobacterium vaccae]|uniref:helix-turn-helix domain-containing protein n=1 Tax=Chryseobacterium vaccae TaxID=2604424 RepID=UPI0012953272|nr:helix-turn-helix domain-containing protein [Chryseobacterium vaccae]